MEILWWLFVGWAAYQLIKISWEKLSSLLYGNRIAVLGERAVGKTHLIQFLSSGTIPMDYEATLDPKKVKGRRFQLKELKLILKDMKDMPGTEDAYIVWKEEFDKAHIGLYLFRADRFFMGNKRTQERVCQDLEQIQIWLDERNHKNLAFFIVGTHCDLMPEYRQTEPKLRATFNDKMLSLEIASRLKLYADSSRIILGSMENTINTEELIYRLFYQIQK